MVRLHLLGPLELAGEGRDARGVLSQPKRLAVLAFLAAREAGEYVRRDTLLGAFWPEQPQQVARRSLRQSLHVLRSHLGPDVFLTRGDDEVAVNPAALECDVARFLADLRDGHAAEGLAWYRGELMAGFYLSGSTADFEHWLEAGRARLRDLAAKAAASLATGAAGTGDLAAAAAWERRTLQIAPDDEAALARLLGVLERSGQEAAALRAFDAFARRMARDLDYRPGREITAIVARLRAALPAFAAVELGAEPDPALSAPAPQPATPRWLLIAAPAALAVLVAAAGGVALFGHKEEPARVLAVGDVRDADSAAPQSETHILPELLANDLTGIGGLSIVPHARLEELAGQLAAAGRGANLRAAAAAAGATELLEGIVYRLAGDTLRLDLRLVRAKSGVIEDALTLKGLDAFALADSAAARCADRFSLMRPTRPLAAVTSSSPQAQVLYQEGLRAFYRDQDDAAAARLFGDAVAADSTFAMAAYYLSNALGVSSPEPSREALALANRMADHAAPREALLIRAAWGQERGDPAWPARADSLAARYPADPESRILAGEGHGVSGDFAGAVADYREAIRLDSLSFRGAAARCLACDASGALVAGYVAQDSIPAALRAAHAWVAVQPRSPRAWYMLSLAEERTGRLDSALAAWDRANVLQGRGDVSDDLIRTRYAIRAGNVATAESLVAARAVDPRDPLHTIAGWWLLITLRNAGRPGAAIALARRLSQDSTGRVYTEGALAAMPLGAVLFEAGQTAEAGRVFAAAGVHSPAFRAKYPGAAERDRAWALAQRATVAAVEGDTAALAWLADSVAAHGSMSPWGRDRRLASYVRGLRLELTGRLEAAADTLRNAVYSPTDGYTRVNLELARVFLALGRPADALPWLQSALRGGVEASNFYVTLGELQDLAGQAFAALGQRDSAVAHYAWVVRAWRGSEPPFLARWRVARDYLASSRRAVALGPRGTRRRGL